MGSLIAMVLMAGCVSATKSTNLTKSGDLVVPEPHRAEALAALGVTEPQFPFPLEPPYQGPLVGGNFASIKGAEVRSAGSFFMVGDGKAFVLSVDGKRVMAGMAGWHTDVKIDPGLRIVTVEFVSQSLGNSIPGQGFGLAQADLQVDARPGSNYTVRFKTSKTSFGTLCIDFWIADATTGKTVTNVVSSVPQSVDTEVLQAIEEYYDLPPYAGSEGAQHAHPPLDQGGSRPGTSGPKYLYTEQSDSASVGVGQTLNGFFRSPYAGESDVSIDQIDGMEVGFPRVVSDPDQQSRLWAKAGKVWLSPAKHALALTFSQVAPVTDGTFTFTGSYTVEAEFSINHMYRFTASSYGDLCCINLWDETGGLATRSSAGSWIFRGSQTYVPNPDQPDVHVSPTHQEHKRK